MQPDSLFPAPEDPAPAFDEESKFHLSVKELY